MSAVDRSGPNGDLDAFLMQVGHAFNMVAELHGWLDHDDLADARFFHPWHAIAESWLLNARLLAEFFLGARRSQDIDAAVFVVSGDSWSLADDANLDRAARERLTDFCTLANKHAFHLDGPERTATPLATISGNDRVEVIDLLLHLGDRLAARTGPPCRGTLTGYLSTARALRSWPPPVLHPGWRPSLPSSPTQPS